MVGSRDPRKLVLGTLRPALVVFSPFKYAQIWRGVTSKRRPSDLRKLTSLQALATPSTPKYRRDATARASSSWRSSPRRPPRGRRRCARRRREPLERASFEYKSVTHRLVAGITSRVALASKGVMQGVMMGAPALVAEELKTPPLGLVALLGRSDLHPAVGEHLRSELRPPLNAMGSGDLAAAPRVIGVRRRNAVSAGVPPDPAAAAALAQLQPQAPPIDGAVAVQGGIGGILRVGWLAKHRQRRPAVALAFLPYEDVAGDPNAWMALTKQLDAVRAAAAAGGARLAVVVVGGACQILHSFQWRDVCVDASSYVPSLE